MTLRAALAYASRLGWAVFPCRGKAPACAHGHLDATTDPERLRQLWRAGANIGMSTPGLLVLDVDPRSGGDDELEALTEQHGELPPTPTQITGGGGAHYVFACDPGISWRARIAPGLDLKPGGKGYILVAPSVHPDTRQRYAWDYDALPSETPVARVPEWLLRLGASRPVRPVEVTGRAAESFLARALRAAGYRLRPIDDRRVAVECPWGHHHTTGRPGDSSTVVLAPSRRDPLGRFHCSHTSCSELDTAALLSVLPPAATASALPQAS